jgi:uncharacterized protein (DUF983 family)
VIDRGYWYCCARCGHGSSWQGQYTDMPPCPKCGDRPDAATLQQHQAIHEQLAGREGQDE